MYSEYADRFFPAGTSATCNRCDAKSPLPRPIEGVWDGGDAFRLREMCTLATCGHLDAHWVMLRDNPHLEADNG